MSFVRLHHPLVCRLGRMRPAASGEQQANEMTMLIC